MYHVCSAYVIMLFLSCWLSIIGIERTFSILGSALTIPTVVLIIVIDYSYN